MSRGPNEVQDAWPVVGEAAGGENRICHQHPAHTHTHRTHMCTHRHTPAGVGTRILGVRLNWLGDTMVRTSCLTKGSHTASQVENGCMGMQGDSRSRFEGNPAPPPLCRQMTDSASSHSGEQSLAPILNGQAHQVASQHHQQQWRQYSCLPITAPQPPNHHHHHCHRHQAAAAGEPATTTPRQPYHLSLYALTHTCRWGTAAQVVPGP